MNDLLLLLWLGDVAGSLSALLCAVAVIGGIVASIAIAIRVVEFEEKLYSAAHVATAAALISAALVAAVIPSKQWFYIAAGGTAAVKALDTDIGRKAAKLIEQKIDEALEGSK